MVQDARTVGVSEFRCWNLSWNTQAQPPVQLEDLADTCGDKAVFVAVLGGIRVAFLASTGDACSLCSYWQSVMSASIFLKCRGWRAGPPGL